MFIHILFREMNKKTNHLSWNAFMNIQQQSPTLFTHQLQKHYEMKKSNSHHKIETVLEYTIINFSSCFAVRAMKHD